MAEYIEHEATCKDCIHYDVCYRIEHYGRELETQEPCELFKSADVVEVVHGEWKFNKDGSGTCNQCNITQKNVWDYDSWQNYCGHCGARMDGDKNG